MLLRIQTVYLFAIIVLALLTCTGHVIDFQERMPTVTNAPLPVVDSVQLPADTLRGGMALGYTLNAIYFNTYKNGDLVQSEIQWGLIILVSLIIGWTLNVLFGYKDRVKQIKKAKINFVIIGMYLAAIITKAFVQIPNFAFTGITIKAAIGLALVIFMLYLNLRALLLIKRDEALVKSADRLR